MKFLSALTRKISESRHAPFNFNSHQDAAEVLQFVIDEPKGTVLAASDLISNTIRINVCFINASVSLLNSPGIFG